MTYTEKIYFRSGDLVEIKHALADKPIMIVQSVDKITIPDKREGGGLLGITCLWFTKDFFLQEKRFNTKDLKHIETK